MKKIYTFTGIIFCFLFINLKAQAQGHNLEFDQVIFNTYTAPGDGNSTQDLLLTTTLVVPPNKVLKVESATVTYSTATGVINMAGSYPILDNTILSAGFLPAGTYTIKLIDGPYATATNWYASIRGVQYNIVP